MKNLFFVFTITISCNFITQTGQQLVSVAPGLSVTTGPTIIAIPQEIVPYITAAGKFFTSPAKIGFAGGATFFAAASLWKTYKAIDDFGQGRTNEAKGNCKSLAAYTALCSLCVLGCRYS